MKLTLSQVEECFYEYVDKEIISKLSDYRKWLIPVSVGVVTPTLEKLYNANKELLKAAGFIDSNDLIDVDLLYEKFHKVAQEKGDIIQSFPILGEVRLSSKDIETLYRIAQSKASPISPTL